MDKNIKPKNEHKITLINRNEMALTGVIEVLSFTDTEISLKTSCGNLLLRGNSLNIGRLNTDTGELNVTGCITILKYSKGKDSAGLFEGLFK